MAPILSGGGPGTTACGIAKSCRFPRAWHAGKVTARSARRIATPDGVARAGTGEPTASRKCCGSPRIPGIFGPDSVTWRVHADPLLGLGGLRALLLQAVHPLAMAGVVGALGVSRRPWGRLVRTAQYIGTVTYGTTADASAPRPGCAALHRTVRGVDPASDRPYSASDPELLDLGPRHRGRLLPDDGAARRAGAHRRRGRRATSPSRPGRRAARGAGRAGPAFGRRDRRLLRADAPAARRSGRRRGRRPLRHAPADAAARSRC